MYIVQLQFNFENNKNFDLYEEAINNLLGTLRMNGQILGKEFPIVRTDLMYTSFVMIPEITSLNMDIANKYVIEDLNKLNEVGLAFSYKVIGEEVKCSPICECCRPESYILFTDYLSLESPFRCGDCFGVIPLYKIPPTYDGEYYDIICWKSDYQACDSLQMNCKTGERFGKQQISSYKSSLTKQGLEICNKITESTGIKTYYYLYRYSIVKREDEIKRKCPSCGGDWLLDNSLHDIFNFRCDKCNILSNFSW